jgi:RNA polymerase sigma-B factor
MAMAECAENEAADEPMDLVEDDATAFPEPGVETEDSELEQVEARIAWHQMVDELDPRLKKVIEMRFYQNLTQSQTARRLGVSQTLVSRLERSALERLRRLVLVA